MRTRATLSQISIVLAVWVGLALSTSCDGARQPPVESDTQAPRDDGSTPPPNIVLLLADDLGWGDTGYNGHPVLRTPHLDRLAADGLRFDRFYAATPVCAPTRASVLTGRHGVRQGVPVANGGHLRESELTIAEICRDAGYATGHFGKWHMGTLTEEFTIRPDRIDPVEDHTTPGDHGFEEWFSTESSVATWDPYDPANAPRSFAGMGIDWDRRAFYWHNGRLVEDDLRGDDSRIIMDRVLPFIDRAVASDRAFFTVVWFHAPHTPVVAGPEYRAMYGDRSEDEQHYFGVVTAMDDQIGRLRNHLEERGVADNTIIWFCSDNGPEGMPHPEARTRGSAGPFRGRKRSLYEGGIRVPAALVWPRVISSGRATGEPAVTSDMLPTLNAIIGAKPLPDRPYDGVDLSPLLLGEEHDADRLISFQFQDRMAVVGPRFKLVANSTQRRHRSDNGRVPVARLELYDLVSDPGETRNIAASQAETVRTMRSHLVDWLESCAASNRGEDFAGSP